MAQRVETPVAECSVTSCVKARFRIGSHTMPGQRHSQPTLTSMGQGCRRVTCHLHFWINDRGLLRATVVTRAWNGHRMRVSTQKYLRRRKFSRRSCRDSNSQPFAHNSGALTHKLCRSCKTMAETRAIWSSPGIRCFVSPTKLKLRTFKIARKRSLAQPPPPAPHFRQQQL